MYQQMLLCWTHDCLNSWCKQANWKRTFYNRETWSGIRLCVRKCLYCLHCILKGVRVIYLRFAWRKRKGEMRRLAKSWKRLSLHKNARTLYPYLFCAWNFHDKTTTSKKCDLISLFLKRGETVFIFCTTNGKTNKNGLAGQEIMTLIHRVSKNKTLSTKKATNFLGGLCGWTVTSVPASAPKNWIQVTAQSLLSSETQGSPGTFSESHTASWGQDSISAHYLAWWYRPGLLAFLN